MHPLAYLMPIAFTVFIWYFTTGIIIVIYGRSQPIKRLGFVGTTLALIAGLVGIMALRHSTSLVAVYGSVTCGVIIWGWQVAGYYLGFITGIESKETSIPRERNLLTRFWLALQSSLYHEVLALVTGIILLIGTWSTPNQWGVWMYISLWAMHASARLNVFFGVRNFRIDFLPNHLHHLEALTAKRDNNEFFPISVIFSSAVALAIVYQVVVPETSYIEQSGLILIATMMTLGILEHWLLVIPLPRILWGFSVRDLAEAEPMPVRVQQPVREKQFKGLSQ